MISVIMLAHNREDYIGSAVESVLRQTYDDFELIIIDNNSRDSTAKLLRKYAGQDNRVRLFERADSNIGAGRNLGLLNACGDYFTFIDDDDYCAPDYLEFLLDLATEYQADIAVSGSFYDMDGELKPKYVFDELVLCSREQAVANFLLRRYFNSGNPTKLFKRTSAICGVRYPEAGRYDDIHTIYKFFAAVGGQKTAVAAKGEPKYIFRRHGTNNSTAALDFSKLTPEWLTEYLSAYKERTKYIMSVAPSLAGLAIWSEWSYMISMVEKINRFALTDCSSQLEYMRSELRRNKTQFLSAEWTRGFEREWMEEYMK